MEPEKLLEDRLEKAYEDMLVVLEGAIARLLEADKEVRKSYWERDKAVPKMVTDVFRRALEKKTSRVFKRAAFPRRLKLERNSEVAVVDRRDLEADRKTADSLVRDMNFSPDLVLEMALALERTASELLQALEEARRVALRVGRRCLESPAMKEISRRAALRRMRKA